MAPPVPQKPAAPPAPEPMVPVRAADGTIGTVPRSQLAQMVDSGGEVVSPEEVERAKLEAQYGGLGGMGKALAAGVGRGLTFGLSDVALGAIGGEEMRRDLRGLQQVNPGASLAGEIGGAVLPMLVSGGTSGGASLAGRAIRTAGALPRGVAALGGIAERGAARLIGEGATSIGGRLVQRAVPAAVGAAVEGAAYGEGHAVSDAAINDHELTAEKVLAGAGKGALLGGAIGGGLSVAGTLVKAGAEKAMAAATKGRSVAEALDDLSASMAWRSAGPRKSLAEGAEKYAGGYEEVGRVWRDKAPELAGKRAFRDMTREDLSIAAANGIEKEGRRLGDILEQVDVAATKSGRMPRALDVVGDIEAVASQVRSRAGAGSVASKLDAFAADVKRITGIVDDAGNLVPTAVETPITYQQLQKFRIDADNVWAGSKVNPELFGFRAEFKRVRDALEQRLETGIEQEAGKKLAAEYTAAKKDYQAWKLLGKATESGKAAEGTNRLVSLTDYLSGKVGSVIGSAVGGPVVGLIGSGISAGINRLVRTRGDFFVSDLLGRVSKLGAVERTAALVDAQIESGVRGLLGAPRRVAVEEVSRPARRTREVVLREAAELVALKGNSGAIQAKVEQAIGPLGAAAPRLTSEIALKAATIATNAAAVAPAPAARVLPFQPHLEPPRWSDMEISKLAKYLDGATDPLSVLEDMRRGVLSREKARAVRENYPRLFGEIRQAVIEHVAEQGTKVPWETRKQASILFDAPLDRTMEPTFVAAMQTAKATPPAESQDAQQMGGRRPIKLDTSVYESGAEESVT